MDIATFNYIESSVGFGIAILIVVLNFKKGSNNPFSSLQYRAAAPFILFGLSDVIEASTGAWWRPTWLLLIKLICVASFVWLLLSYIKKNKYQISSRCQFDLAQSLTGLSAEFK